MSFVLTIDNRIDHKYKYMLHPPNIYRYMYIIHHILLYTRISLYQMIFRRLFLNH